MVAKEILKSLKSKYSKKVVFSIELIELCSKNGNTFFHKLLAQPDFSDMFLILLKRVIIQLITINSINNRKEEKLESLRSFNQSK